MGFTHLDSDGSAIMVDVTEKANTARRALAVGRIRMGSDCFDALRYGSAAKGDVLGAARIAGIMAAKKTADLIPLCHPLGLSAVSVEFLLLPEVCELEARCTARCQGQTGVEMEALTGVTVALLTIYDMCKAMDKTMVIGNIHLAEKDGGKSGCFRFSPGEQTL